jgi:hypothetical protein
VSRRIMGASIVALITVCAVAFFEVSTQQQLAAQQVLAPGWANIPGLGPVDLKSIPPELREKIQLPGQAIPEPEEQYQDFPSFEDGRDTPLGELGDDANSAISLEDEPIPLFSPAEHRAALDRRERKMRQMYGDRAHP